MAGIINIPAIVWLIVSALFVAVGDVLSKKFAQEPSIGYVVVIMLIYSMASLTWLPAILQKNQLSTTGAMWSVLTLLVTVLLGIIVFNEHLTIISALGIIFALVAVVLLSLA